MERVIPIFQALISTYQSYTEQSDVVEPIDRYYGELGYALKDQRKPNWKEALECFDKAIVQRDNVLKREPGLRWFEMNRIYCWINLENEQKQYKSEIINDLRTAINSGERLRKILNNTFSIYKNANKQEYLKDVDLLNVDDDKKEEIKKLLNKKFTQNEVINLLRIQSKSNKSATQILSFFESQTNDQKLYCWLTKKVEAKDKEVINILQEFVDKYEADFDNLSIYLQRKINEV